MDTLIILTEKVLSSRLRPGQALGFMQGFILGQIVLVVILQALSK
jgi:hypothetical protein